MHPESYALMEAMLGLRKESGLETLDVGSLDVNGSFRSLVERRGWRYTGLDIIDGENVDVVSQDPFRYPFPDGSFDAVISGSTMEHVTAIWRWIPELARLLKPGGLLALHTHWKFPEHRYPVDCWRIMPDGMRYLLDLTGTLERCEVRIANRWDITATAWRTNGKE